MSGASFATYWTASVLPPNSTKWELAVEATCAAIVAVDPVDLIPASRSSTDCPNSWLAYLAAERAVDEWDSGWTEAHRRAVIANSFEYHRHQGTRRALDFALEPLGYSALTVREWFETTPRGIPYTFTVTVVIDEQSPWVEGEASRLIRIVNRAKNAHTRLTVSPVRRMTVPIYAGAFPSNVRKLNIGEQPIQRVRRPQGYVYAGGSPRHLRSLGIIEQPIQRVRSSQGNVFVGGAPKFIRRLVIGPNP